MVVRLAARSAPVVVQEQTLDACQPHLHGHAFTEVTLVLSGRGIHRDGAGVARLAAGDAIIVAGAGVHGLASVESLHLVVVQLAPALFPWADGVTHLQCGRSAWSRVRALADALRDEQSRRLLGWSDALAASASLLLVTLRRVARAAPEPRPTDTAIAAAVAHLESRWNRRLSVSELTRRAALPRSTFLRRFSALYGCGPLAWQQRLRVIEAARRLVTTDAAIASIAHGCGWRDANTFTRRFRRHLGISPSRYRAERRPIPASGDGPPRSEPR